ncbi:hypothetical protein J2T58_001928 [Methanocalculus alkaliphilus]|uniref:DUF432 domain-containing protein n=1 Tax=Methanocalculus alkaliphilus TaxID=768730 RepID=UPI0020A0E00A|nr:DUF432 domain-containing protein [Methanocalculus alkaliphilus]MCP1716054.1 hypothetical protein [Methanocalculus alkaliphilus]
MYGRYGYQFCVEKGDLKVCFSKDEDFIRYFRSLGDKTVERIVASESGTVYINPVEPLNLPDEVTRFLEIRFEPILIEPEAVRQIYLTFPIEIGVFLGKSDAIQLIDVFSRMPQKYSLYGPTDTGVITRYYWSAVYLHRPSPDPWYEGVLELTMHNTTKGWIEVSRVVFENYGMKIYFDQELVSMKAHMQIIKHTIAETSFIDKPMREGMQKSIELYYSRKIPGVERAISYTMEEGMS